MATCAQCGSEVREGAWTCGKCGAPVAGAGMAAAPGTGAGMAAAPGTGGYGGGPGMPAGSSGSSSDWLPEYQQQAADSSAAQARSQSSGLLRTIVFIAVVAIVAIVLVWFFVLRGPKTTGEEFLGTWTATTQKGIATAVIARKDDAFSIVLSGAQPDQKITVPAHLDGTDLVVTMDDFSQIAGEANADRFKEALRALAGDFRMVFSSVDATSLSLRLVGTAANGLDFDQTIPMTKDAATTT